MFAYIHPVNNKISQYSYLKSLITCYRYYVEEWEKKFLTDIESEAIDSSEGEDDKEIAVSIYTSIYSQGVHCASDKIDSEDELFYKAMLIMVYSYYEGIINKMAADAEVKDIRPSSICEKYGKELSEESKEKAAFLFDNILPLRNHLCHNDCGTKDRDYEKTVNALKILFKTKCIDMDFQTNSEGQIALASCSVFGINEDFILDVLDKEHDILIELSEKAGYENQYIDRQPNK